MTKDMEMVEVLHTFFASVFTRRVCPQASHVLDPSHGVCGSEACPTAEEDWAREHPSQLNICKSMGSGGMDVSKSAEIAG